MECRKLELTLVSASNLPDIRHLGRMRVYAKVFLEGPSSKTCKITPVDKKGETNPTWNVSMKYTLSESTVQQPGVNLVVKLYCKRTRGDKVIGEVNISVKGLYDMGLKSEKVLSYSVAGTMNGRLNILYSFGEKIWVQLVQRGSKRASAVGSKRRVALVGFMVLVRGAVFFLSGEDIGEYDISDWVCSGDFDDDGVYCDDDFVYCDDDDYVDVVSGCDA